MANKFTQPDYAYFVFARGTNASYGFSTYQDHAGAIGTPGSVVCISYRTDQNGKPQPYHFNWSMRDRVVKVRKDAVDTQGINIYNFLKNAPDCKGSPNGRYVTDKEGNEIQVDIMFKERDEENDTKQLLEAKALRLKAETIASNLTDEEIFEIAVLFGEFSVVPAIARHTVLEVAGNKPQIFLSEYENADRRALSLLRRALKLGVLSLNGTAIVWNKTTLGLDENEAAAYLKKEDKVYEALEKAVKRIT